MMGHIQRSPEHFYDHFKGLATAIIMDSTYGIEVKDATNPLVVNADVCMEYIAEAGTPGAWLVDLFPILKLVPEWVPGAGFQRKAKAWKKCIDAMVDDPFAVTKKEFNEGAAPPSFTAQWLEKVTSTPDPAARQNLENTIRNVAGAVYAAGFETTSSSLAVFILGMILNPSAQIKAQHELDTVIGSHRMPTYADLPDLPYVNAVYKEILRWRPVAPMGVPHRTIQEDVYKGMRIPKGSLMVCNAWYMLRNEAEFGPDPDTFNPDRFLKPGVQHPIAAFGFGRRICPGRYLADNTILMAIASILHLFHIEGKSSGVPASEVEYTTGFLMHPHPFECDIRTRGPEAERLLEDLNIMGR